MSAGRSRRADGTDAIPVQIARIGANPAVGISPLPRQPFTATAIAEIGLPGNRRTGDVSVADPDMTDIASPVAVVMRIAAFKPAARRVDKPRARRCQCPAQKFAMRISGITRPLPVDFPGVPNLKSNGFQIRDTRPDRVQMTQAADSNVLA